MVDNPDQNLSELYLGVKASSLSRTGEEQGESRRLSATILGIPQVTGPAKDCGGCDRTLSKSGPRITRNMDWIWIYPRGLDKSTHAHMHKTAQFLL